MYQSASLNWPFAQNWQNIYSLASNFPAVEPPKPVAPTVEPAKTATPEVQPVRPVITTSKGMWLSENAQRLQNVN